MCSAGAAEQDYSGCNEDHRAESTLCRLKSFRVAGLIPLLLRQEGNPDLPCARLLKQHSRIVAARRWRTWREDLENNVRDARP